MCNKQYNTKITLTRTAKFPNRPRMLRFLLLVVLLFLLSTRTLSAAGLSDPEMEPNTGLVSGDLGCRTAEGSPPVPELRSECSSAGNDGGRREERAGVVEKPDPGPSSLVGLHGARYKSMSPARLPIVRTPCLTIPPGFSPSSLLESPVLITNRMVRDCFTFLFFYFSFYFFSHLMLRFLRPLLKGLMAGVQISQFLSFVFGKRKHVFPWDWNSYRLSIPLRQCMAENLTSIIEKFSSHECLQE